MATYSVALKSDGKYLSRMGSNASREVTDASVGTGSDLSSQTAIPIILWGLESRRKEAGAHRRTVEKHRERRLGCGTQADSDVLTSRNQTILPSDETERRRREAEAGESIQYSAEISIRLL